MVWSDGTCHRVRLTRSSQEVRRCWKSVARITWGVLPSLSLTRVSGVNCSLSARPQMASQQTMKRGHLKSQATTRRARLFLLLGFASLLAWILTRTGGAEPWQGFLDLAGSFAESLGPRAGRCPELADRLLEHWQNRTQLQAKRLLRVAPSSTAEVLRQLGLVVRDDYCYFKMRFNGTAVEPADDFTEHCEGTAVQVLPRAYVYAQLFNRLLRQRAAGQHLTPFEFYMDLNSGTRNNVELFRRLRVPILSFSRNPHDRYTVPLPDFHLTLGVYNDSLDYTDAGFGHLQGFANDTSPTYQRDWAVPWSQKVPKLVYRGSCFPSLLSDAWSPSTRLNIRAELCGAYGSSSKYDIGLRTGAACLQPNKSGTPMCAGCAACFAKPDMSWEEQLTHKYQVVVDGIAGNSEGMAMKLLSNSAVIRLRPNGWDSPLFQLAYEPLLEAYEHIMQADIAGLPAAIEWCEANPGKCQQMASAGRSFMQCFLRTEVLDDYIYGVFKYMHDSLAYAQHTSAEYNYALNI